jgi:sulfate/thiosulfate transport system ATP-binding protein
MSVTLSTISKTFGSYAALKAVNLTVQTGKLTCLLGPSGSGKTTLLRIIAGLEFPDEGSGAIYFDNQDVTRVPAGKRHVGFVFQHYALFKHMSVFDNIAFGLKVKSWKDRLTKQEIADKVHKLIDLVQLGGLDKRYPTELSGGQRQRVALARALAIDPKILLLDEPFGALDAKVRKDLRRWLRKLHEEVNLTTIFVTHDQEEALEISDEIVVMNQASIEQVGKPQDVYDKPATPFVYAFLGKVNQLQLPSSGFANAAVFNEAQGKVAYVRPHDIDVFTSAIGTDTEAAYLVSINTAGPLARIWCARQADDQIIEVEMARQNFTKLNLKVGDWVYLRMR